MQKKKQINGASVVGNDIETTVNMGMLIPETFQKAKQNADKHKDTNKPCAM